MRATVYANCQASPVLSMLSSIVPGLEPEPCPAVHTLSADKIADVHAIISASDIVIHQPISSNFGPLSSDDLKAVFPQKTFLSFPSIYFGGFFPQLTYLRPLTGKGSLRGPLTEYHDARIVASYLEGKSPAECLRRIEEGHYDMTTYFDTALTASRKADVGLDVPVMDIIEREMAERPPLYTFNHPTNPVIWQLVHRMVRTLGLHANQDAPIRKKPYLDNCVADIDPRIPAALGAPWTRSGYTVFGKKLEWPQLIAEFYELYDTTKDFARLCYANKDRLRVPIAFPETAPTQAPKTTRQPRKDSMSEESQKPRATPESPVFVGSLISDFGIGCFSDILPHYCKLDPTLSVCVDGGAGLGETADKIIKGLNGHSAKVLAFEPNPTNVAQFIYHHDDVILEPAALGDVNGTAQFLVTATTKKDDAASYQKTDTSFVGKLEMVGDAEVSGARYDVKVERLDSTLARHGFDAAHFIKLDLQGGELSALKGLGNKIKDVHWMWIEYGGQEGLLEFLIDKGFVLFDTEYLFVGRPNDLIEELFEITRIGSNSIGKQIFFGSRRHIWRDYVKGFSFAKRHRRMIQTDLVAVAPGNVGAFLTAAQTAADVEKQSARYTVPRKLF